MLVQSSPLPSQTTLTYYWAGRWSNHHQPTLAWGSVKLSHWNCPTLNERELLEAWTGESSKQVHKSQGQSRHSSLLRFFWRQVKGKRLHLSWFYFFNLPVFYHMKFSLPKKTVPCAALIRSYNHPKMKMATGARSLLSHSTRFTMTASISHKPNSMWDVALRCNL